MYTADQVAEILHLHPKTIRRFIRQGTLKARKVGKQWRITERELKDFIGDTNQSADESDSQKISEKISEKPRLPPLVKEEKSRLEKSKPKPSVPFPAP